EIVGRRASPKFKKVGPDKAMLDLLQQISISARKISSALATMRNEANLRSRRDDRSPQMEGVMYALQHAVADLIDHRQEVGQTERSPSKPRPELPIGPSWLEQACVVL